METIDQLVGFLTDVTGHEYRGRLLARGEVRSIIRQEGDLPPDAPRFAANIAVDLADYGFSLLRASMALREAGGPRDLIQLGFERAANAFESLIRNGSPRARRRGFYRALAGAAYHLADYSAIAFSLFNQRGENANFSPAEDAISFLVLRDLQGLRNHVRAWLLDPIHSDRQIRALLEEGEIDAEDAIVDILNSTICRALAYFDLALQTGDAALVETARELLRTAIALASDAGAVPLWWISRLCLNLLDDLWSHSLHETLPQDPPPQGDGYRELRSLFLSTLYARSCAEVELWPSQRDAARRCADPSDDLVVALPTSAGKTRIAEIAALISLAQTKRVLMVTPLRALSAQTERTFRKTFAPLGFSVSSLYGASGISAGDQDALRQKNIVIATPEKLDFALRSDPTLIDDIGLIVLDEGHLIGPSEREIRYEILVQRLLRRPDAADRRIVCLSAILPEGRALDDLTSWIRSDAAGEPVQSKWRPTRQRFGTLVMRGDAARLTYDFDEDGPFISRFIEQSPPIAPRRTPFPRDKRELTFAAAWKFAEQGKRTLIFCTQRDHVEGMAGAVVELHRRGFLPSLLDDEDSIERACEIGREWLGEDHAAVKCLAIGVAVHHARLPNPFLREVERLLGEGVLKVTIASPTLAQGLNLNAAVLLVPNIYRAGAELSGEEFANVAGRAGRAFVDVEGLVIHVIYEPARWRLNAWEELVHSARARNLESGLVQIIDEVIQRLARGGVLRRDDAYEFLANSREAWQVGAEDGEESTRSLIEKLDNMVFGLIEALDSDSENLPQLLDEALNGSLWARQIGRRAEDAAGKQKQIMLARAGLIWTNTTAAQRRGHYAMGVGLEAGLAIDEIADELGGFLGAADLAALGGDEVALGDALIELARRLLLIPPFQPDDELPDNWEATLRSWISGETIEEIGPENVRLIEDVFSYRLVWALEAIRTRRTVLGLQADIIEGGAAASLETGVPKFTMALLVRAGLPSRQAAIAAVNDLNPIFIDNEGLLDWLRSDAVAALTDEGTWPTEEAASIWRQFREDALAGQAQRWTSASFRRRLREGTFDEVPEAGRTYRVEIDYATGDAWVTTPDFRRLACIDRTVTDPRPSLLSARFEEGSRLATITRIGRARPRWAPDPE